MMKARGIQFWTLLLLSTAVSLLMIEQIFLSHAIIREQHVLVDSHETADTDSIYQSGWEKLAMRVWRAGAENPAMFDLLKSEGIAVHEGPPPGAWPAATNAAPVPAAAWKPVQAAHPETP